MFKVISFESSDKDNLEKAFTIRRKVFVEEQAVDREEEYDGLDETSKHYLVFSDEGEAIGTSRWRETDKEIKLERFAVLQEFRNNGAGSVMLQQVLKNVKPLGKTIFLNAQVKAMTFYLREGFETEGELFYEANIAHYKMIYRNQK